MGRADAGTPSGAEWLARIALGASLALSTGLLAEPALARPARTTWTTYLRAGPGVGYEVIDEIEGRSAIDVQECGGGWCRVVYGRAVGYVAAGLVATQDEAAAQGPAPAPAATPVPCFEAQREGYPRGEIVRYCGR